MEAILRNKIGRARGCHGELGNGWDGDEKVEEISMHQ